jgi:hypothetical protein
MHAVDLKDTVANGRYAVSTVALGDDYWDGARFETMVFDTLLDDEVDSLRYLTPEAALAGHAEMVRTVQVIEEALAL